jgi:hypothetical protein
MVTRKNFFAFGKKGVFSHFGLTKKKKNSVIEVPKQRFFRGLTGKGDKTPEPQILKFSLHLLKENILLLPVLVLFLEKREWWRVNGRTIHKCDGDIIFPCGRLMTKIRIVTDENYRGEGISEGLARGLLVFYASENLTGEGMGIGNAAVKGDGCTYFSRSFRDAGDIGDLFTRTFFIDTKMGWSFRGKISPGLTRLIELGMGVYMRHPRLQKILMAPSMTLRKMLGIEPGFETVSPRATVSFSYRSDRSGVGIVTRFEPVTDPPGTLCILNELSGRAFTAAWERGMLHPPPRGWERLPSRFPTPSVCDPKRGIRFWIDSLSVTPAVPVSIFKGRETGDDVSWAGISFEACPCEGKNPLEIRYHISFAEGVSS